MPCEAERVPDDAANLTTWSDSQLLAAARQLEEDPAPLEVLVRRHARVLERRCLMLTSDRERARDLAQETWTRMVRARATMRAEGSVGAFLAVIAANLWRDERRLQRRARQLSEQRLLSLDGSADGEDDSPIGDAVSTAELTEEMLLLRLDLRSALARLPARLRDVVIARHVAGESAAEIGRRFGRTEQTITSWLREALARLRQDLRDWQSAA